MTRNIIAVDPFRCRIWEDHCRMEEHISEESCKAEIESFIRQGQLIPALGRPLPPNPAHDVELIFGARRLFVARTLKVPLLVELREISDQEAILALEIENQHREDISPYERGRCYDRWLKRHHFASQDELAQALGISPAHVSRLLTLARLPTVVVGAFRQPADICETWAQKLYEAWQDPGQRTNMARRARTLAGKSAKPEAPHVYETLLGGARRATSGTAQFRDEVVTGNNGTALFRVSYRRDTIALMLPAKALTSRSLRQVKTLLIGFFQDEIAQGLDSKQKPAHRPHEPIQHQHDDSHHAD